MLTIACLSFQAIEARPLGGIHIAYKGRFVHVNVLFHAEDISTCFWL